MQQSALPSALSAAVQARTSEGLTADIGTASKYALMILMCISA